ncbi:DUF2171 domain-containing protein [Mesorhizobium sp. ANAO-SY3R2]
MVHLNQSRGAFVLCSRLVLGHHHFIPLSLVVEIENGTVRLSANADVAV